MVAPEMVLPTRPLALSVARPPLLGFVLGLVFFLAFSIPSVPPSPTPALAQSVNDELILLRSRLESLENDFGTLLRAHQELVKLHQEQTQALEQARQETRAEVAAVAQSLEEVAEEKTQTSQATPSLSAEDQEVLASARATAQQAVQASTSNAQALEALRAELAELVATTQESLASAQAETARLAEETRTTLASIKEAQAEEATGAEADAGAEAEARLEASNSPEVRLLLGRLQELEGLNRATTGALEQLEYRLRTLEQSLATAFSAAPPDGGVQAEALDGVDGVDGVDGASALTPEQAEAGTVRLLGEVSDSRLQEAARESAASVSVSVARLDGQSTEPQATPETPATPQEQYAKAFALLRANQYAEAETELRTFLEQWPEDDLSDNARYWLGETLYVRKEYQAAARVFAEGLDRAPDGKKAPDNLLKLGLSFSSLGENEKACQVLLSLATRYEQAPETILRRADAERNRLACS